MKDRTNITLIGMPGSGKSFVGKHLATVGGYTLIDQDLITEQRYGMSVSQVLAKLGNERFVEVQSQLLMDAIQSSNLIISTGGSAIYSQATMAHLKEVSVLIYLKCPLSTIQRRIKGTNRGIVGLDSKSFEDIYIEREVMYAHWCDLAIESQDLANITEVIFENCKTKIACPHPNLSV